MAGRFDGSDCIKDAVQAVEAVKITDVLRRQGERQETHLHMAAQYDTAHCLGYALACVSAEERAELLTMRMEDQWAPLHVAAHCNTAESIKVILDSVNPKEIPGLLRMQTAAQWTPLHYAANRSTEDYVETLLSSVDEKEKVKLLRMQGEKQWTPLHLAARYNTGKCARAMLNSVQAQERAPLLAMQTNAKWTPLHQAARSNTADCVKMMLLHVSDEERAKLLAMRTKGGWTPLHLAARYNTPDCVRAILESVNEEERAKLMKTMKDDKWTPLHMAANYNTAVSVKHMIDSVSEKTLFDELLPMRTKADQSVLDRAICNEEHPSALRLLLSHIYLYCSALRAKELILATDSHGDTLLHHASQQSHLEAVQTLTSSLDRGILSALASIFNSRGRTASDETDSEAIKRLIESAATPVTTAFHPDTPPTVLIFYTTAGRYGAEKEANSLSEFFIKHKIKIEIYKDPTSTKMSAMIKAAVEKEDVSGLIVALMSHGSKGKVDLYDMEVRLDSIVASMSAPTLNDKPKLLLVQACQNEGGVQNLPLGLDAKRDRYAYIPVKKNDAAPVKRPPPPIIEFNLTSRNFLVLMATVSGAIAYRNALIPYLVEEMEKLGPEDDIYLAFLKVSWKIQDEFPAQTPIFLSTMTQRFCLAKFFK